MLALHDVPLIRRITHMYRPMPRYELRRKYSRSLSFQLAFLVICISVMIPTKGLAAQKVISAKAGPIAAIDPATKSRMLQMNAHHSLGFEPNWGQAPPAVRYTAHGTAYTLFLTSSDAIFVLPHDVEFPATTIDGSQGSASRQISKRSTWASVRMHMVGARSESPIVPSGSLPGKKNYFIGIDKSKWAKGVPLYSQVNYQNIYPGIDVAYKGLGEQVEFDFIVSAGANPRRIKLSFGGTRSATTDASGDLLMSSSAGDLRFRRPLAYQESAAGERTYVDVRFVRTAKNRIGFNLGPYDKRRRLIIDPSVTFATYFGGTTQDEGLGVATDSTGDTFVTGATNSPNFPITEGQEASGGFDVFVAEFDPQGQLIFSTLLGGSQDDVGTAIAVSDGNIQAIYLTGWTESQDFPILYDGTNYPYEAGKDGFLVELTLDGSGELGGTFLPGDQDDIGTAVAFDDAGDAIVVGQTFSDDFILPVTSLNSLPGESQINLGNGLGPSDGFIVWVAGSGTYVYFSSYLGGTGSDMATGVALDNPSQPDYNILIAGSTNSVDFPFTNSGVVQPRCGTDGNCNGGLDDAFITKVNNTSDLFTPVYSTYLGGSATDDALSLAADSLGAAYITGVTNSPDFKIANPLQSTLNGTQNAFISKLNSDGTALVFSTYLGGSGSDAGLGLAIDGDANIYVTGRTTSPDFPLQFPTQETIGGRSDAFVSVLSSGGGSLTFSTYLGGSGDEDILGGSIAVDAIQNVYLTGDTNSANFPTISPYQATIGSTENCTINGTQVLCPDAFVAKIYAVPPGSSTLTIAFGPDGGGGLVSSSPAGIDCASSGSPSDCSASYTDGTVVTLSETTFDSQFGGWSGPGTDTCGTNPTCQITLNQTETVTADFMPATSAILSVNVLGNGTGSVVSDPPGINCPGVCFATFVIGSQITLTPNANSDSYFSGWSVLSLCSGTGPCIFAMPAGSPAVTATFNLNNAPPPPQADFSLTVSPLSLGTVSIGSTGVAGLSIVSLNGFNDTVALSCSVQPTSTSAPTCTLEPDSVTVPASGGGSATLTVNTTGLVAFSRQPSKSHPHGALFAFCTIILGLASAVGSGSSMRRRRSCGLLFVGLLLLALLGSQVSCSGSGNSGSGNQGGVAQAGTYTVLVNAQGTTTSTNHSVQLTVTIQ